MGTLVLVQGPPATPGGGWTAGFTAVADALGTFVWPVTVLIVVWMFRGPLRGS
jgi:hypothetical protein